MTPRSETKHRAHSGARNRASKPTITNSSAAAPADAVLAALADRGLVFVDPEDGLWKTTDEYLSGEVKTKLRQALAAGSDFARMLGPMLVCAAFYWVNAVLLRTVHQWAGVPFELDALLRSVVAQSALSLLWTSTALVLMFAAGRSRSRALWMTGAVLLGVVVLKLFVNDLGNTGTVARIVSFIGVGVLLLVIGYVAPVPPPAGSEKPAAD